MTRRQRSYPVAPPGLWDREDMRSALAARDMAAVITIFRRWTGASQTDIGVLLGMPQPHVSDFERGIRHATSLAMFERLADGLGLGLDQIDVFGVARGRSEVELVQGGTATEEHAVRQLRHPEHLDERPADDEVLLDLEILHPRRFTPPLGDVVARNHRSGITSAFT